MAPFKKLVRFAQGNQTHYGDLLDTGDRFTIRKLIGSPFNELKPTEELVQTDTLLAPLESTSIIQCVGLNYGTHAKEASLPIPKYPAVFTKPADALAGPYENIPIHPDARELLDYEGELTVIIGRDAKNVPEEQALDYVMGYTAGNDISARHFQLPEVSGGQFCYAKSFDKFAPIGHAITAASEVPDPQKLKLTTWVNGVVKQETSTSDMIFGVRKIISHLTRGMTLRKGTIIMTGTPSGVGYFRKEFLKEGDVVEVEVEGVGKIRNKIEY